MNKKFIFFLIYVLFSSIFNAQNTVQIEDNLKMKSLFKIKDSIIILTFYNTSKTTRFYFNSKPYPFVTFMDSLSYTINHFIGHSPIPYTPRGEDKLDLTNVSNCDSISYKFRVFNFPIKKENYFILYIEYFSTNYKKRYKFHNMINFDLTPFLSKKGISTEFKRIEFKPKIIE